MRRLGFIVPALLLVAVFFVLCLGILSKQPIRNSGALQALARQQARQVALAGIDEARLWLATEPSLSPLNTDFTGQVEDPDSGLVGSYVVTLDYRWAGSPYGIVQVESEGILGTMASPQARYRLSVTVDITDPLGNPDYLKPLRWRESLP